MVAMFTTKFKMERKKICTHCPHSVCVDSVCFIMNIHYVRKLVSPFDYFNANTLCSL